MLYPESVEQATAQIDINNELPTQPQTPYQNVFDDHYPPKEGTTVAQIEEKERMLRPYGWEMLNAYIETQIKGESLWQYFVTSAFIPHIIKSRGRPMIE